jgi:hypothetical protein
MAIGFKEFDIQQFRAQIAKMSDAELISMGRILRSLCEPRLVSPNKSTFDIQLEECRAEWRRRHPLPRESEGAEYRQRYYGDRSQGQK